MTNLFEQQVGWMAYTDFIFKRLRSFQTDIWKISAREEGYRQRRSIPR